MKENGKKRKEVFSQRFPEISLCVTESNHMHKKGKHTHHLSLSKAKHTPTRSIIPAFAASPPPLYTLRPHQSAPSVFSST